MKKPLFIVLYLVIPSILFAQQWEVVLPDSVYLNKGIITEENTILFVGCSGNNGSLIKMYDDGQYETTLYPIEEGNRLNLYNIIPLANEGFFVSGGNSIGELQTLILDKNFTIEQEQTIQVEEGFLGFMGSDAVMDDDGTIVLLATARRTYPNLEGSYQYIGVLFRFSQTG
jgi:hypothetical protein